VWLLGRGIEQWSVGEIPTSAFETQVTAGEWHLVRSGRRVVACLRLLWADAAVWGETPPAAGYVHGLTTDRQHAGGLGCELLDWVGVEVTRRGRTLLRLDCQERNHVLRAYYRRLGFEEVGVTDFGLNSPWHPVVRFERSEA